MLEGIVVPEVMWRVDCVQCRKFLHRPGQCNNQSSMKISTSHLNEVELKSVSSCDLALGTYICIPIAMDRLLSL